MNLTFEQIISAANGIVRTEQNDLGLELHRFTHEQEGFRLHAENLVKQLTSIIKKTKGEIKL